MDGRTHAREREHEVAAVGEVDDVYDGAGEVHSVAARCAAKTDCPGIDELE